MDRKIEETFNKLVEIELLVSEIYMKFSAMIREDSEFWWRLSLEEKGHASIIRSGQQSFASLNIFPEEFEKMPFDMLESSAQEKREMLKHLREDSGGITRKKALAMAIKFEERDVENLFQELMQKTSDSKALALFKRLNKESQDHARRLLERMELAESGTK